MSTVIRLSDRELKKIQELRTLYNTLETLKIREWALAGIGDYVIYDDLEDMHDLLNRILFDVTVAVKERIENESKVIEIIAKKSFSKKFGARNMRRFIQSDIEDRLAEYIISNYDKSISSVELSEKNGEISIKCK